MNILLFIKNLPYSEPAVNFGGTIARLTNSSITLLFASTKKNLSTAERTLARASALLPDLPVSTKIRREGATAAIMEEVETGQYEMIVLMARRAIRLRKRIQGKIGREIARSSPISVLIVKTTRPGLNRILICTSGLQYADHTIKYGTQLAQAANAQITVLHVTNPVPSMYTGLDGVEETLPELLQSQTRIAQHLRDVAGYLNSLQIDAHLELRHGDVIEEILRKSEIGNYDLVVLGASPPKHRIRDWVLGDITQQIVNHIRCPVLVVRQPEAD